MWAHVNEAIEDEVATVAIEEIAKTPKIFEAAMVEVEEHLVESLRLHPQLLHLLTPAEETAEEIPEADLAEEEMVVEEEAILASIMYHSPGAAITPQPLHLESGRLLIAPNRRNIYSPMKATTFACTYHIFHSPHTNTFFTPPKPCN